MANVMKKAVQGRVGAPAMPSLPRGALGSRKPMREATYGQALSAAQYQEMRMRMIMARCNPAPTVAEGALESI